MKKSNWKAIRKPVLWVGLSIALVAIAVLLLCITSCQKSPAAPDPGTESTTESTVPTTAPTQPTKPTETTKPTEATQPTGTTDPTQCLHLQTEWVVVKEATCQAEGSRDMVCTNCKVTLITAEAVAKVGHTPSDWLVEREATCAQEGLSYSECTVCKAKLASMPTEKLSHTPGQWVVDQEASCSKIGFKRQECTACGETIEEAEIPMAAHTTEIIPGKEATEKEPGLTDGERCTVCRQITKPQQSIPPSGTAGLLYEKNPDGKTYSVAGISDTCEDTIIYIPSSHNGGAVTAIGDEAFANCDKVEKVYLPETVTAIGDRAFYNSGLTEFTIPEGVKTFGNQIFFQAQKLETVYYNSDYTRENGSIFGATAVKKVVFGGSKVPAYVCRDTQSLTQIVIEKTVTEIGAYAFENCTSLAKADIPSSVVTVGDGAFKNCTGMAEVTIPDSISVISTETFAGCASLTEVVIPGSVTRIGTRAFANCGNLSKLTVPVSVTNIGQEAFAACTGLTEIHYRGTQAQWNRISKSTDWDKNAGSYTVKFAN